MSISSLLGSSNIFILLVIVFVVFIPLFRLIYRQSNNIIPDNVLTFPFTYCDKHILEDIHENVRIFTENLRNGKQVELKLSEFELNCLANRGRGADFYSPKIKHYDHYKLEDNLITWERLSYPSINYDGFLITKRSITLSLIHGKLEGSMTSIAENGWKFRFGKTDYKFNGWKLFKDIFDISSVDEMDNIVSKLKNIYIQNNSIQFISK
jgi:hypothetical protein